MRIAIIGAMKKEIEFLLHNLGEFKETKSRNFTFYEGSFQNHQLMIVSSGIGKTASGILVSSLVSQYPDLDLIINIGVSGGIHDRTSVGDVVVATALKYADVDVNGFDDCVYGQVPGCPEAFVSRADLIDAIRSLIELPYRKGMILSGDQFFTDRKATDDLIITRFPQDTVLCMDMESAALAHGAWFYGLDYLAIRAISDIIGDDAQIGEYEKHLEMACMNSNLFLLEVLKHLKNKDI